MDGVSKKVTMKDIAEKLNMSINAVSLALNNKSGVSESTRQQVLKTADELEYLEKNSAFVKRNQLNNICVMIEEKNFRDTRFYSRVILGIEDEAKKYHYDVIVNFIDNDHYVLPQSIEQGKAAGIIIVGSVRDEFLIKAASCGIPMILADHASFAFDTDAILTQNTPGTYAATKYLIENGHKEIGFFGEKYLTLSFNERWIGFCEAMRRNGLPVMDEFCFTDSIDEYAARNDYQPVARILKDVRKFPTAWVCANDCSAIILISALNSLGFSVPGDISVIGFDDIDLCKVITPNLTTIRVEKELMGVNAVRSLLFRMENRHEPNRHNRMTTKLIERDSVKRLKYY